MSEMVERVARALYANYRECGLVFGRPFEELPPLGRQAFMNIARAAIEAMREPSEDMRKVADEWCDEYDVSSCYTLMIEEALR